MKLRNRYLNGLDKLLSHFGNPNPEIGVMGFVLMFEAILLVNISIIFHFRVPLSDELGNKWIVRIIGGILLILINRYIFGIRETVYRGYKPLSKGITILITLLYFAVTLGFWFYSSKR